MPRTRHNAPGEPTRPRRPDPGPWGLFLVSVLAMFALAPRLNGRLGDFWSQAAILPIWAAFYALIHFLRLRREARHDRR